MRRLPVLVMALFASACGGPARPQPETPPATAPVPPSTAELRVEGPPASMLTTEAPAPVRPGQPSGEDAERVLFLATHLRTDDLRKGCS